MRVLILSGTSNTGTALAPHVAGFADVVTAGRQNCDCQVDLSRAADDILLPERIDVLVITAAAFAGQTIDDVLHTESVNALGTIKLCAAAARSGIRHIVLISTALVTDKPATTTTPSAYALSKKHSEELAQLCCSINHISLTILRPSRIYGDSDSFRKHQPFLYTLADRAEANQRIEIFGSGDAKRNFIHVDDLCQIVAQVIQQKALGIFTCLHPQNVSIAQIANAAQTSFGSQAGITFLSDRPEIADDNFQPVGTLYQHIGMSPQISIEAGLTRIAKHRRLQKHVP